MVNGCIHRVSSFQEPAGHIEPYAAPATCYENTCHATRIASGTIFAACIKATSLPVSEIQVVSVPFDNQLSKRTAVASLPRA